MKKNMKGGGVKYYPIKEVLNGGIFNALGIKLDQMQYDWQKSFDALNNFIAYIDHDLDKLEKN